MKLIEIKNDCFNVAKRLKQINKKYKLHFNAENGHLELRSVHGLKSILELSMPDFALDSKVINYVLKTKIENMEALITEIDLKNKEAEKEQVNKTLKKMQKCLEFSAKEL